MNLLGWRSWKAAGLGLSLSFFFSSGGACEIVGLGYDGR